MTQGGLRGCWVLFQGGQERRRAIVCLLLGGEFSLTWRFMGSLLPPPEARGVVVARTFCGLPKPGLGLASTGLVAGEGFVWAELQDFKASGGGWGTEGEEHLQVIVEKATLPLRLLVSTR